MDWDDLRYVLALTRSHTMSAAGSALGVTHTTVGRRLRAAETRLGVRLFDRTPDGLVPTPAGHEMAELAERLERDVLATERKVMGRDAELRGKLRVSMVDYLFWGLHGDFSSFVEQYPHVELTITATDEQVSLIRRQADVVLRLTESPPDLLIGRRLGDVAFGVYASDALVAKVGPDAPLQDYPWIGWDERLDAGWFDGWLNEHAPGAKIAVRIDESAILRSQTVRGGMGAFFLPTFEAELVPGLQRLGDLALARPLWLLTLPELRHTSRVRALMNHIAQAVAARGRVL